MKKSTKGAIAASAAVALLLSGGGTLAYWNDQVNAGEQVNIKAGNLQFKAPTAPTWTYTPVVGTAQSGLTTAQVTALRINPGDKLTSSGTYKITAQGSGLKFKVDVAGGSIVAATPGNAADDKLATTLVNTAAVAINGGPVGNTGTITHTSAVATDYDVKIDVTLTWPFDGAPASDNVAKLGSVNLGQFAVSATQLNS